MSFDLLETRAPRSHQAWTRGVALCLAVLASAVACASTNRNAAPDTIYLGPHDVSEAQLYMPLENGTVYSYDTRTQSGEHGVMTIQVLHATRGQVDVAVGGRTERLISLVDGIRLAEGGYYLKSPLTKDHSWEGRLGTVRVADTQEELSVPAGHFTGCVRTIEEARELRAKQTISSVYCPHVGLVMLDVKLSGKGNETAVLRSFGPRIDPLISDVPPPKED